MPVKELNTQQQIHEAANKVFMIKGFDGARMQEIADEAGINKALLHYYYRSKDKLFEAIFKEAIGQFIPKVGDIFNSDKDLKDKIGSFIGIYIDQLIANPFLPMFILHEINRDHHRIIYLMRQLGLRPENMIKQIQKDIKNKKIKPISPEQLIVNMLSMCIFPFAARPLIQGILFNNDKNNYDKFLLQRKKEVTKFILNAISID